MPADIPAAPPGAAARGPSGAAAAQPRSDVTVRTLLILLRAEGAGGVLGLGLFVACIAVATALLGAVWMLGSGLSAALATNSLRILGGDLAIEVANTPLAPDTVAGLDSAGILSTSIELRTSAGVGDQRAPVELKAVDDRYPLYGAVQLDPPMPLAAALATVDGRIGAVAEAALLARFGIAVGDPVRIGDRSVEIRAVLRVEPDRLSSGAFMVGPRLLIAAARLPDAGLLAPGALADFRYRLRTLPDQTPAALDRAVAGHEPARGWELDRPADAGGGVRRIVHRTTTFLGIAGVAALAIALSGAWMAASVWVARRGRTIALYRLSGATPLLIVLLHAAMLAAAAMLGLVLGLAVAAALAVPLMDAVTLRLHLSWSAADLVLPARDIAVSLVLCIAGAGATALSAAAAIPPGSAMRSGDAAIAPRRRPVALGLALALAGVAIAVLGLPVPRLAGIAAGGLAVAALGLGLAGWLLAAVAARRPPRGFTALVALQGLARPAAAATKALTIGIGIAGITAVVATQGSLGTALRADLPARAPDLVLLDIQPDQADRLRRHIEAEPGLGDLQATPFMRAITLEVNGRPAAEALVREDKRWVITGDRSFAWTAEPTDADLLAGQWWPADYSGPVLLSPEEDMMQAFDLKPGDTLTFSVLGRRFTGAVANIRKEYHRTFRPESLLLASPEPFRTAPHSWIMTLRGDNDAAIDGLIRHIGTTERNITAVDVRPIIAQVTEMVETAVLATLGIAAILLLIGALSLAAVTAADVDARRREAIAFALIGASRRDIGVARLAEAVAIGVLAALVGGLAGWVGGWWLVDGALQIDWRPGLLPALLPVALGAGAAVAAGLAGGLGSLPRGRGAIARLVAA